MQNIKQLFTVLSRKLKIGTKLFLLLVMIILMLSLGTFTFARQFTMQISNQFIYQYLQSEQTIVADNISMYLEEIIMVSLRFKNTIDFYQILKDESLSEEKRQAALIETASTIQPPATASISNIYLIDNEDHIYLLNGNPELPLPNLTEYEKESVNPYYCVGELFYDLEGNYYIPVTMDFYNYQTFQKAGYLVFYLPQKPVAELFHKLFSNSDMTFLTNSNGVILSHSDEKYIGADIKDWEIPLSHDFFSVDDASISSKDCIAVSTSLDNASSRIGFSWRLYTLIPQDILYQNTRQIQFLLMLFAVMVVIIASFLSLHLSSRLTDSIKTLSQKIKNVNEDNLHSFLDPVPKDELWELEQGYNEMLMRINDLLEKNKQEQIKKRELEFTALQAQINPHFLYNTLDTIGWIATLKGQPEIEQMVMELSRFFRLSLHKGEQFITLEDELGIVSSYLKIEQLRNPGKFDVDYEIQSDLLQIKVPKLILQPIVENAIKHGISQVRRHGKITIHGYHVNDDVYLEVQDNGNGIQMPSRGAQLPGSNYGLKNIRERIQLEYGEQYGLSIESHDGEGTTVQIHIHF